MDKRTLKALKGSIEKWRKIVAGTGVDLGAANCALCDLFQITKAVTCLGCPVMEATHKDLCGGTPYKNWISQFSVVLCQVYNSPSACQSRACQSRGCQSRGCQSRGCQSRAGAKIRSGLKVKRILANLTRINGGYQFLAFRAEDGRCVVIAGCRGPWTTAEYRKHVKSEYPKTEKADETLAILDFIDARDKAAKKAEAA